jgi:hypothetical protein
MMTCHLVVIAITPPIELKVLLPLEVPLSEIPLTITPITPALQMMPYCVRKFSPIPYGFDLLPICENPRNLWAK